MPKELLELQKWTIEQAKSNEEIRKQIAEEELFNPWVVTDFDEVLTSNKHVKKWKLNLIMFINFKAKCQAILPFHHFLVLHFYPL